MLPSSNIRVTSLITLLCCVIWGIVYQTTQLKPFATLTATTFPASVGFNALLWNHQNDHNNATTTNQTDQELLFYEAIRRLTSQDLPRRNNSRRLCGVIPNSSPPAVHFPNILHSSRPHTHLQPSQLCRPNAILYMVQKESIPATAEIVPRSFSNRWTCCIKTIFVWAIMRTMSMS